MKNAKDLIEVCEKANPNGVVLIINNMGDSDARIVTNPAFLNVSSYSYWLNGKDITEGKTDKDFVGLPFYHQANISFEEGHSKVGKKEADYIKRALRVSTVEEFKEILSERDPNSILISFDGYTIEDISLNRNYNFGIKTIYGDYNMYDCNSNDFIILVKGEKLDHRFEKERMRSSNTSESIKIKRFNELFDGESVISAEDEKSQVETKMSELEDLFADTNTNFSYEYECVGSEVFRKGRGFSQNKDVNKLFKDSVLSILVDRGNHDWEIVAKDNTVTTIEVLNGRKESTSRFKFSNIDDALHIIEKEVHRILGVKETKSNKK